MRKFYAVSEFFSYVLCFPRMICEFETDQQKDADNGWRLVVFLLFWVQRSLMIILCVCPIGMAHIIYYIGGKAYFPWVVRGTCTRTAHYFLRCFFSYVQCWPTLTIISHFICYCWCLHSSHLLLCSSASILYSDSVLFITQFSRFSEFRRVFHIYALIR